MTKQLYCQVRQMWVAAQPEEYVRQKFIQHMINDCGFPLSLISVEKSLKQQPHMTSKDRQYVPDRRADLLVFAKEENKELGGLYPLLIVECKAVKLNTRVIDQVIGYNRFVHAPFIALVNDREVRTGWYEAKVGIYTFVDYLPTFQDLKMRLGL